jgi:hypothetical protein
MKTIAFAIALLVATGACSRGGEPAASSQDGIAAFETVRTVLQNPRCQNCHISGDAPLQLDDGRVHAQNVVRGPHGNGPPGLACSTCHARENPPASYGANMPPGAPGWRLPPPDMKMVFMGLSSGALCRGLKDPKSNGGRTLEQLTQHISSDKLVLWGWSPGVGRKPVPVPHETFVAKFKEWVAAGGPCAP